MALTIFYTANLRGDLALLPRLYTFLRQLQRQHTGRAVLLDAGAACDEAAWHCAATGGRSALLVLDAMGYDAANVCGFLSSEGRARLAGNLMRMMILCEGETWARDDVVVTTTDQPAPQPHALHIVLNSHPTLRMEHNRLYLASVQAGQVGIVQVGDAADNGRLTILHQEIAAMPASALPDPTIAGTVDFVLDEARYYRRRGDQPSS